jgi:hypothetical protein
MAFVYGDSYYGLRTWGSSNGDVKDASAALTATSSAGAVNWVIAIGAAAATTATASVTCSGEKFILEESDRYTYGSGLYGYNVFAGNADLQTIVSATSSIANVVQERVREASATSTATATIAAIGGMRRDVQASMTSNSSVPNLPATTLRVREAVADIGTLASITANATCTWNTGATVTAAGSLTGAAIQFFLESSDKYAYGSGLYGTQRYDQEDLQTIVSATSVGTSCVGAKVNLASAVSSASSSVAGASEKIHQPSGATTANSSVTSRAEAVYISGAQMSSASTTAFTTVIRVREDTAAVSSTSGTATIGREKWEVIVNDTNTWTQIAA